MREFQKTAIYRWEDRFIAPTDRVELSFDSAQSIINYIWTQEGWLYPPLVKKMRSNTTCGGRGNRLNIWLPEKTFTWVLIHELCHTLTMEVRGSGNHGPDFLGMYMKMLDKYCKISLLVLMHTAEEAGLKYNLSVQPYFLDKP